MSPRLLLYTTMGWPTAARYAGGFAQARCEVLALAPPNSPVALSRYTRTTYPYSALTPMVSLKRAIAEGAPDLIVACDDRAVAHLLDLGDEASTGGDRAVAALICRSLGSPENYPRLISRAGSMAALAAGGIDVPETVSVEDESALHAALTRIGLPAVLKSDGSWGGDGVAIVKTHAEALSAWRRLSRDPSRLRSLVRAARRRDPHFLRKAIWPREYAVCLQRFIPGYAAASAFAAWQGKVVAAFHYDVVSADQSIGPPNVIRRVECAEMDRAAEIVARTFSLSGLHGIDYIRDAQGKPYVLEVNPRATQGGTLPFGPGRDLPAALTAALTGTSVPLRPALRTDLVTFFPREWKRDPDSPYLGEGHHDVPWDDPDVLRAMLGMRVRHDSRTVRTASAPDQCGMGSGTRGAPLLGMTTSSGRTSPYPGRSSRSPKPPDKPCPTQASVPIDSPAPSGLAQGRSGGLCFRASARCQCGRSCVRDGKVRGCAVSPGI
jgi:hypothetical protein